MVVYKARGARVNSVLLNFTCKTQAHRSLIKTVRGPRAVLISDLLTLAYLLWMPPTSRYAPDCSFLCLGAHAQARYTIVCACRVLQLLNNK